MRVRNSTGVTQVAPHGSWLLPGVWLKVPEEVSYLDAIWMNTRRKADLDDLEDSKDLLWKTPEGTHVYWLSPFSMGDGYATAAENMIHALTSVGCQISVNQCWFMSKEGLLPETIAMLRKPEQRAHRVGICMATPGEFKKLPTPYRIGLTMYESDDPLVNLPEWKHDCGEVDLLVVPCSYCKDVFEQFVTAPVVVSPLSINPMYHTATKREPKDTFTFITFGTLSGRKSPLETLDAFKKAFPLKQYPNVRFEFKTRLGYFGWGENQLPGTGNDPRVSIISADWFPQKMLDWMHNADAMVFASKGEGFGMPPREAIATGLPTILSNNTGLIPMCDPQYTFPIQTGKTEDSPLGGNWYLPDWDELIETMRWVYNHREEAYQKGQRAAQWFAREHGPASVGRKLLDIIEGVSPADSSVRNSRIPNAPNETVADHTGFFDWFTKLIPAPGPVWDMGVGEGILYKGLIQRGYEVVGIVAPENLETAREKLAARGVNAPKLISCTKGLLDPPVLHRSGVTMPAVCASMGVLQQLGNKEIALQIRNQLGIVPQVLFSVPSVYYPKYYAKRARLLRHGNWMDILSSESCILEEYGTNRSFLHGRVYKTVEARGLVQRKRGRTLQGVWHKKK